MRKFFQILLATALLITFSWTSAFSDQPVEIDNNGCVEAVGYGPIKGQNVGISPIANARRVAVMDARRSLAESIGDLHITSNTTVNTSKLENDYISGKVDTLIRSSKVVSVTRTKEYGEDAFKALVRLSVYGGSNSLSATVLKQDVQVEDFPPPKFTNIASMTGYTGIIIDCRGRNLSTAIAPAIKSEDNVEIYSYKNIGYDTAVSNGMVSYSTSMDSGVERAGNSPLKIAALRVSGDCDVIVNAVDADKILAANQSAHFLNNCAVVFVR